jgi:hypothetical protein
MVACHYRDDFMVNARLRLAHHPGQEDRQALQSSQAALRFGQIFLAGAGPFHGVAVERLDLRDQLFEFHLHILS